MIPEISTYISDLLYEHQAVIIPNLGGFVTDYKSTTIDHVQGLLYPPSKSISFNENLLINDGILIAHVRKMQKISALEARQRVEDFVRVIKDALDNREIVVFPEVGRLYRDYEKNIQFLPDSTNYNTDVFGLPTVQFYPILRTQERATQEAPAPTAASSIPHQTVEKSNRWRKLLRPAVPYLIAGLVVLSGVGIYMSMDDKGISIPSATTQPISLPDRIVNQSPTTDRPSLTDEIKVDEDDQDRLDEEREFLQQQDSIEDTYEERETESYTSSSSTDEQRDVKVPSPKVEEPEDTEAPTLGPDQKVAVVIVHAFGKKENVRSMTKKLMDLGYNAYSDKHRGLTRVGVKFVYNSENELDNKLKNIRKKLNPHSYKL